MSSYGSESEAAELLLQKAIGKTPVRIVGAVGDDEFLIVFDDGSTLILHHIQDCCESVVLVDIAGSTEDLIGYPLLKAEERCNRVGGYEEPGTWTFYSFATIKGYLDLRWLGTSNGYYSESVDIEWRVSP